MIYIVKENKSNKYYYTTNNTISYSTNSICELLNKNLHICTWAFKDKLLGQEKFIEKMEDTILLKLNSLEDLKNYPELLL